VTLISAHRCETRADFDEALASGADFIEFDVHVTEDRVFVLYHDEIVPFSGSERPMGSLSWDDLRGAHPGVLRLPEALELIRGRAKAHVDFKFVSPRESYADPEQSLEVIATKVVIDTMGVENCIITTLEDDSVEVVRRWSSERYPDLLVGLSLGRKLNGSSSLTRARTRRSELYPDRRIAASRANLVVSDKWLARLRLANWAKRKGLPLLVWTVDAESDLRYWLNDPRAWLVTTNHPALAMRQRAEGTPPAPDSVEEDEFGEGDQANEGNNPAKDG
jgi:glycerophosphoryl diester phosphodiesterase